MDDRRKSNKTTVIFSWFVKDVSAKCSLVRRNVGDTDFDSVHVVIRPGSSAAEGVSVTDLNKRASLNSTKKQLLKNLSIFVSRTRLCVHNLPPKLNDKALRKLFKRHSPPEARITEVRGFKQEMMGIGLIQSFFNR